MNPAGVGCVRAAHSMQSSLFRTRFESAMDYVASQGERKCVATMPERVMQSKAKNRHKLQLCAASMSEEEQDFVLSMLNEDWDHEFGSYGLIHYCEPGCCESLESCRMRLRKALEIAFGSFFEPPLMYRWKGWEPASHYLTRGLAIHKLLLFFWMRCMSSDDRWFDFCFSNLLFERPELLNVKVSKSILNFVGSIGSATQASV